jgi:hypothetical protein
MKRRFEERDVYSGLSWVYVEPNVVREHPKGKLNPILWAIVLFLVGSGILKLVVFLNAGAAPSMALLSGLLPVLTGLGLALRVPFALVIAIIMAGITLYSTAGAMGSDQSIWFLFDSLVAAGIIFYLLDGDRPNFIYRHRYRKYSELSDDGPD